MENVAHEKGTSGCSSKVALIPIKSRWASASPKTNTEYLQRYDSRVVADNFKFGADKNIIVALEHNVLVANKKDMAKVLNMTSISEVVIKANLS